MKKGEHVSDRILNNFGSDIIYMCANCNNGRSNRPYTIIEKVNHDFLGNIQKQISRIGSYITAGKINNRDYNYEYYPAKIKKRIKEYMDKDINIDTFLRNQKKRQLNRIKLI